MHACQENVIESKKRSPDREPPIYQEARESLTFTSCGRQVLQPGVFRTLILSEIQDDFGVKGLGFKSLGVRVKGPGF